MNKIIPFEKEVVFKNNVNEITSISLEQQMLIDDLIISGEFIISGEYKVTDTSTTVDSFKFNIPINIRIDDNYITDKAIADIDDFYYEVINNSVLKICIDIKVDKLEEKPREELVDMDRNIDVLEINEEETIHTEEEIPDNVLEPINNVPEAVDNVQDKMNSLFSNINSGENYISYNIYIIREGDTLETILEKYGVTEEQLKYYNELSNLQIGDKIVVPNI